MLPCAHSPAFSDVDIPLKKVNPKVASEFISSTYLPCILDGLARAPRLSKAGGIFNREVKYLITPNGALGSKGVLGALNAGIEVLAIKNNVILSVDCKLFKNNGIMGTLKEFSSYEECINFIRKD